MGRTIKETDLLQSQMDKVIKFRKKAKFESKLYFDENEETSKCLLIT